MKLIHLIFLLCGGLLVFAAYEHADEATASIGQNIGKGGFDRFQEKTKLSDQTLERGGEIFTNMVEAVDKRKSQEVSVPAPDPAIREELRGEIAAAAANDSAVHDELRGEIAAAAANDSAVHDELRGEIAALKSRVSSLEKRPECKCNVVAAPAAPAPVAPEVSYEGGCANGQCGTGFGGRFFGRRR